MKSEQELAHLKNYLILCKMVLDGEHCSEFLKCKDIKQF